MNGFELNIGTEMLKRMDEADKKLQQIASHSEEVSKAMKKLSTDGINSVVNGLSKMSTQLSQLSQNKGFSNMGTQASQSVDAINKLVEALAKLTTQQQLRLQTQQAKVDYKKEVNDLKELAMAEDERTRALNRQNKANIANDKHRQALETKKLANDTKELMNIEQERGRQLILQNQKSIAAYTKQSVKLKQQINEINRLAKAYRQMPTNIKQVDLNKIITSASKAKTINQHIVAIHNLNNALKDLDTTSKNYQQNVSRITAEINRNKMALTQLGVNIDSVNKKKRNLMDTAGQLQRKLALIFSVSQIVGYVNNLVNVRKEMELQQKSLEVLLQSKSQADRLWQQTLDLAVKSPFRVKELITYTRNLAAYRIETDKLHETTRRLSDVSAGLGVDMQRLILAYGQVRAANYLRGTELRQFTEAGIPMLDELAKHLTALEGTTVSVSDVFDRISKRLISFKDVAKVFENMTSAGGAFYRMQEEQSTTLHGMISNLHDSIDIMLNDIGKANDGFLKGSINVAKNIIENWQLMAEALQALALGFAFYKMNILLASDSLKLLAIEHKVLTNTIPKQLTVVQALKTGYLELSKIISNTAKSMIAFVAANPFITLGSLAIATLLKIGFTMHEHNKALKSITENYDKLRQKLEALDFNFNSAKAEKNISQMKKNLLDVVDIANRDYGLKFKVNVEEMNTEQIEEKFKEISQTLFDVNIFTEGFAKSFQEATEWTIQDDVFEDIKELGETATKVFETMYNKRIVAVNRLREKESELTEEEKKALSMLSKQRSDFETELDFLENLSNAFSVLEKHYGGYNKTFQQLGINISDVIKQNSDLERDIQEAFAEYWSLLDTINLEGLSNEEKTIRLTTAIDAMASQNNWNQFVKDYIYRWTHEKFDVEIGFKTSDEDGGLLEWQQTYNEMFSNLKGFKEIEDSATKQSDIIERLNTQLKTTEELYERMQNAGEGAYSNYQLSNVKQEIEDLKTMRAWFGESDNQKSTTGKDWMSEVVKGIKEAHQEYIKLNKTLGESESKQMALDKYAKSFAESARNAGLKDISLGQFEFETEGGAIEALEFLKNKLPQSAKQARFKLEEAIGEIRGEVRIRTKAEDDKMLIEEIEDMFSGYEMSIELQKLNIPKDLAKQLFNVDSVDLSSIRNKISSELAKAQATGGQEDRVKELKKQLDKVEELEDKAMQERLKKYTKYLVKAQGERVKIKMEELRQLNEIETLNFTESQKSMARMAIQQESKQKMDKLDWEDFKNSGMYVQLFEDIEYVSTKALTKMRERLITLKDQLSDLDADDLRNLYNQIEKLDEQLAKRNPYKGAILGVNDYIKALKESKRLEKELDKEDTITRGLKRDEAVLSEQLAIEQDRYSQMVKNFNVSGKEVNKQYNKVKALESQLEYIKKQLLAQGKLTAELEKQLSLAKTTRKTFTGELSEIGGDISAAASALPQVASELEHVFGTMSDGAKDTIDSISDIAGGVGDAIQGFASQNYIQAVSGVVKAIGAIFAIGDKKKERQIQREIKFVEDLERVYEKLGKAIDNAYSINTLQSSGKAAKDNLEAQIASYEKMIAAEEDKKKTDDDRIKEWQLAIEDLIEQKAELDKQLVSTATGGIMDDVLSTAQEFTNAWLEAFNKTGDGLSGLEDNFKETMLEMIKQQASMLISNSYIEEWKKKLEQYINPDDLELSTDEAKKWVNAVTTSLPQLNQALENYFTAMQQAGVDLGGGNGELSGLQRGIQGVTEETAQIIEAYLNSIRFFVAEQTTYLSQIAASFGNTEVENPMVEQLRIIAAQTSAINSLLQGLVRGGHSLGGSGLKVFIS